MPERRDGTTPRKQRLSAMIARDLLAREMWMNANAVYDGEIWDVDSLPSTVYEKYIARAERAIREAMGRV